MTRYTKAMRERIVKDFAARNGGIFDAVLFEREVRDTGPAHPAFDWFEWDDEKAALDYRIAQARNFARGLIIRFDVHEVHGGVMRIITREAPLVISPYGSRCDGGGYVITDPDNPAHMRELRFEAARALRWLMGRYSAALGEAGVDMATFDLALTCLEDATDRAAA